MDRFAAVPSKVTYWDLGLSVVGFGFGGVLAILYDIVLLHLPEMSWTTLLFYFITAGLMGVSFQTAARIIYPTRYLDGRVFIESCLLEDCCPACGYRLRGLAQEADGCVQCPECGAHWKPYTMPPEA
jgi:hypothetical protein